jgi:hypothetical protein
MLAPQSLGRALKPLRDISLFDVDSCARIPQLDFSILVHGGIDWTSVI